MSHSDRTLLGAHKAAVALATFVALTGYTLLVVGMGEPASWMGIAAINASALSVVWLGAVVIERNTRLPRARVVAALLFYPLATLIFFVNFAYYYFFESSTTRHVSLLEIDLSQLNFFFTQLLPPDGWAWMGGLGVGSVVTAKLIAGWLRGYPTRLPATVTAGALVITLGCVLFIPEIPHPFVDAADDLVFRMSHQPLHVDPLAEPGASVELLYKSTPGPQSIRTRFKKVVMIVMETVPADTFARDVGVMRHDAFLRRMSTHAHHYANYHTPNQDSRTAMLAMLTSRWVPYEAYDEEGLSRYEKIQHFANLPQALQRLGYATSYMFAQQDSEAVVSMLPWKYITHLPQTAIDTLKQKYLCFHPYEFENSCEDKVLLPDVVKFLSSHEKAFVVQELMWGHNLAYNTASGKGNVPYVGEYLDMLWQAIAAKGMADQTLLILTADHGDKADARVTESRAYQVPLYFFAPSLTPKRDTTFYSHLDFREILFHELDPRHPAPPAEPFIEIVGPTESSLRAVLDPRGGFIAYQKRGTETYLMAQQGNPPPDYSRHVRLVTEYTRWFEGANR